MNTEAAGRAKRERRRANEIKTRTIQRMQLQMTAPLDIGLEQHDASLGIGQDDMFDLGGAESGLRKRGGIHALIGENGDLLDDSDEEDEASEESDDMLDSEEEREKQTVGLEAEMDGLYDAYRDRLRERDAKFKVKESRQKNAEREEWHGIQDGSREEDSDEEEGGWDRMDEAKRDAEDSSSDESDDDEEVVIGNKRRHPNVADSSSTKRQRLVTTLKERQTKTAETRAAQVWFSQNVFAGMEDVDDIEDEEAASDDMDVDGGDEEGNWEDAVNFLTFGPIASPLMVCMQASGQDSEEDDFEVVPQTVDGDVDMWDVSNEDEDAVRNEKIQRPTCFFYLSLQLLTSFVDRAGPQHPRSNHTSPAAGQSREDANRADQRRIQSLFAQLQRRLTVLVLGR